MSNYFYSASRGGFYSLSSREHYEASPHGWPDDAVAVTDEEYKTLLDGQAKGKIIKADTNGRPVLADPVIDWQARAENQRQSLLTAANAVTADWRTELQLGVITDDDKASLIKWMACIKELKALKLDGITDEAGYNAIVWPDKPQP